MQLTFLKLARLCKDRTAEQRGGKKKTGFGARIQKCASEVREEGQPAKETRAKWAIRHFNELVFKSTIYSLKIEHLQQSFVTSLKLVGTPVGLLIDVE